MRKNKRCAPVKPFAAGLCAGFITLLILSALSAVVLLLTDASGSAGAAAVVAIIASSFVSGRAAGKIRRRGGIKTGAICGAFFAGILLIFSIIFGEAGSAMIFVKILMSVAFGAAGGIAGVNCDENL